MAVPNLRNIINGFYRPEMIPTQEEQSLIRHDVYGKQQTNKFKEVGDPGGIRDNQRVRLARATSDSDLPRTTANPTRRRTKSSCCFGCPITAVDDDGDYDEEQVPKPSNSSAPLPGNGAPGAARTLVLTTSLHCEGCTSKVVKKIKKIEGVEGVRAYIVKDMIEVDTSTLCSDWLPEYLSNDFRRKVELVLVRSSDHAIGLNGREGSDAQRRSRENIRKDDIERYAGINVGKKDDQNLNLKGLMDFNHENTKKPILHDSIGSEVHSPTVKLPNRDTVMNTIPNSPEPKLKRKDQKPDNAELPQSGYVDKTRHKNNSTPGRSAKYTSQRPNLAAVQPISDSLEAIATSVAVLKVRLHCHGCADKIRRKVLKIRGVEQIKFDIEKELMEVQGTMDIKQQLPYLTKKLKRNVQIIQLTPCSSPENSNEDNKEDTQEAQTKEPVTDKVENVQESGLSTINDQMSKIDDKRQDQSLKTGKEFLDLLQEYISREVESPKSENECDKKYSDESEESGRKKLVEKVPKEEDAKGGVAVGEVNKDCAIGYPPIYNQPNESLHKYEFSAGATPRLIDYFHEENANACSIM